MGRHERTVQGEVISAHCLSKAARNSSEKSCKIQYSAACAYLQGVSSPLAGQMLFRSIMFGSFAQIKTWLATNKDGSTRQLTNADFYKVSTRPLHALQHIHSHSACQRSFNIVGHVEQAGAATGLIAAFVEGPIDFYKSQIQVQIIRSRADPNYKRKAAHCNTSTLHFPAIMHIYQWTAVVSIFLTSLFLSFLSPSHVLVGITCLPVQHHQGDSANVSLALQILYIHL